MFKTKKFKLLATLIIITLIANLLPGIIVNAAEPAVSTLTIENAEQAGKEITVKPGDEFAINILFANPVATGKGLAFSLQFDTTKLEVTNMVQDTESPTTYYLYDEDIGDLTKLAAVLWDSTSNLIGYGATSKTTAIKAGTAFTAKFRVKEGATGTFAFNILNTAYTNVSGTDEETYPIIAGSLTGTILTPLQSISLNKDTVTLSKDSSEKLTVTYHPTETTDDKTVTWSVEDQAIATVAQDGTITAKENGTTTVTATCGDKTASATVIVTSELQSISLNKETLELAKGQEETLIVSYNPVDTTDPKDVVWTSSNEAVAIVNENGTVTAVANGDAIITATCGDKTATCAVNVSTKLQSISLDKETMELNKGTTEKLTVRYLPEDTTDPKNVVWTSSNEAVATVAQDGTVTAVAPGQATIVATCGNKTASCAVEVKSPLTAISIGEDIAELLPKQEVVVSVVYTPEDTTDDKTVVWTSSDESIATVKNGKITAIAPGTVTITATCGTITDSITVTVPEVHMDSIAIKEPNATIAKNETKTLEVVYYPENTTDDRKVTWTVDDETIATVSEDGTVTAIAPGTATITATCGDKTATATITVVVPLTSISLDKENARIEKGTTTALTVLYNPEDTTDAKDVVWTSLNPSVATVDENGVVTALASGTAVIKAQVGDKTATCTVTVFVPLTGIEIKEETELQKGQTETLTVTFLPEDTTEMLTPTWTSSNPEVATVSADGTIQALKEGTATITVTVGSFVKTCQVTVKEIKLDSIEIDNQTEELVKGKSVLLHVLYNPENTTDNRDVIWTSSDEEVAIVTAEGLVIPKKAGVVTITAKVGDKVAEVTYTVKEIALKTIEIEAEQTTIKEGETVQLVIKYNPEDTTDDKSVVYLSSDDTIATVNENGIVTAHKAGKVVITAVAENGITSQIEIEVQANQIDEENTNGTTSTSPKTGDIHVGVIAGIMIISLLGMIVISRKK